MLKKWEKSLAPYMEIVPGRTSNIKEASGPNSHITLALILALTLPVTLNLA